MERPVQIPVAGVELPGMLYLPEADAGARPAVLLCDAFADERKAACLAMVRLARALAARGFPVLRFDYRGCGDGPGDFRDATVSTRLEDIAVAAECLKAEAGRSRLALGGMRLGAALAARAAQGRADVCALVLLEPIADGRAYVDGQVRRKLVRQMMTAGRAAGHEEADAVDLDGYALGRTALGELRELGLAGARFEGPVLIVQVSFNEAVRRETEAARAALQAGGARTDLITLVLPPFWSRIDLVDTDALDDAVGRWLQDAAAQ